MKKKQLRRRIKELEAYNKDLADINCNFCLEMACLSSANRALQARVKVNNHSTYAFYRYNLKIGCKEEMNNPSDVD